MNTWNTICVLVQASWREWAESGPKGAGLVFLIVGIPLAFIFRVLNESVTIGETISFSLLPLSGLAAAALLGSGIVSRERQQGILMTLFARPLRRATYIFSKWLALVSAAMAVSLLAAALHWLTYGLGLGQSQNAALALQQLLDTLIMVAGSSAILVVISVFTSSSSESPLYVMIMASAFVLNIAGQSSPLDLSERSGFELWQAEQANAAIKCCLIVSDQLLPILLPAIDFQSSPQVIAFDTLRFLALLSGAFYIAVSAINRKELTYGAQ